MKIHRDLKDIPTKSADDPNLYDMEEHILDYDFVRTNEKKAFSFASKKMHQSNPTVQITHFDGKHHHVVSVTPTQARCYNTVNDERQNNKGIDWDILRMLFRYNTINVLVKKNLLKVVGDKVLVGTYIETSVEIMEKGGVGKMTIIMPA